MIENQPKELTLIYHSDKAEDKKARAFIETVAGYAVKTLDLKRDHLTQTQLAEIADKMSVDIKSLFNATYADKFSSKSRPDIASANDSDLLTILVHDPILINTPITIIGSKAYSYGSAYELLTRVESDKIRSTGARARKLTF